VPTVFIPTLLQPMTGGRISLEAEGATVREVIESLERECPGIAERLMDAGRLRANLSVAVDGEITPLGLLERVRPESEVHFVAAIKGGAGAFACQ
jgi:molybdopterin converting factor small subunit